VGEVIPRGPEAMLKPAPWALAKGGGGEKAEAAEAAAAPAAAAVVEIRSSHWQLKRPAY
jgi:hypothetical protein